MTLNEFLKEYEGKVCKIGSGTGFIFCDTINDNTRVLLVVSSKNQKIYRTGALEELIIKYDSFDNKWKETSENMRKEHRKAIEFERMKEKDLAKKEKRKPRYKHTIKYLMAEYDKYLVKRGQELKDALKRRIDYEENYLNNWKDYLNRDVKEIYDSFDEEDTKICIFEGDEHGKWWTTEEYRTGVIK